jgi:hypothetical protein
MEHVEFILFRYRALDVVVAWQYFSPRDWLGASDKGDFRWKVHDRWTLTAASTQKLFVKAESTETLNSSFRESRINGDTQLLHPKRAVIGLRTSRTAEHKRLHDSPTARLARLFKSRRQSAIVVYATLAETVIAYIGIVQMSQRKRKRVEEADA